MPTSILWLRRDLRLHDLPALTAAAEEGEVLPVFVLDEELLSESSIRSACLLRALTSAQEAYDGAIVVRRGRPEEVIPALVEEAGAGSVHVSVESQPYGRIRDQRVRDALGDVPLVGTGSPYAVGPGTILTKQGGHYKVFTPFSRAWREHGWPEPARVPAGLRFARGVGSQNVPAPPVVDIDLPAVGEQAALDRWRDVLGGLENYHVDRDRPDMDGTSKMSVHLKYGTVHPRTLLADLDQRLEGHRVFATELAWREFYADVLWHNPDSLWTDLNQSMSQMAYDEPGEQFEAWKTGHTGYPYVDAAMRQLLHTGWMHNRARMATASFLTKHLHVWWPHGARWFLERLVDGDPASNNHGWQWVAGTGTDAAPYFRIFNPVTQGKKFDPLGHYVREWVPELRHLGSKTIHEPWKDPDGYRNGYPRPIIDLSKEREEALNRLEAARNPSGG